MYRYSIENIKDIISREKGKALVLEYKKFYDETYKDKPLAPLCYLNYKRIYLDGNRTDWQVGYYERRRRLALLQILAIYDESYLNDLEEILFAICNEFTWILPAHSYVKDSKFNYNFIDLFSSETGFYLAETAYVFGDKLSIDIRDRIKASLKQKIVDPFESETMWWEEDDNNWTSVCSASVGATYLLAFPERFNIIEKRVNACMEQYLNGLREDGTTTEGVLYWDYGFSFFCLYCDVYREIIGKDYALKSSSKVKKTISFINNAIFEGGLCIPFADGWVPGWVRTGNQVCMVKNIYPDEFRLPKTNPRDLATKALGWRVLYCIDKFGEMEENTPEKGTVYYESGEWFISRQEKYNFVAKCGNNSEMHNHCDVGTFEINANGVKIISDPGAPVYTWEFFNDYSENGRYGKGILLASSYGHSLPIVNGKDQYGYRRSDEPVPYAGKVISHSETSFAVDIAGVYRKGEVDSLVVSYDLTPDSVKVKYTARGLKDSITFRFVTELEPEAVNGAADLKMAKIVSKSGISPVLDCPEYVNKRSTLYTVDFPVNRGGDVEEEFEIILF